MINQEGMIMANRFQKLLFNLSTMSPLVFIYTIVYWVEKGIVIFSQETKRIQFNLTTFLLIALLIVSALFSFYSVWFVRYCRKKIERVPISIDSILSNDNWVIAVIVSYALPAVSFVFEDININIGIFIILIGIAFLALSNVIFPNPFLMIRGYHFYKITTIDGSSDICLLSKRKSINNRNIVNTVMVAFDYLAIEESDKDV